MNLPTITFTDGSMFDLDNVHEPKLLGHQIEHKQTGRILPDTHRNELYSYVAAIRKMNKIAGVHSLMNSQFEIWDYIIIPLYEGDIDPKKCTIISDRDDYLHNP